MRSLSRRGQVLVATMLAVLATLTAAASTLAGGAPGPWPQ